MKKASFLIMIAALGLSGCVNRGTPKSILESAASAVTKNNLKKFKQTLTGNALSQYGNDVGIAQVREKLSGFKNLEASSQSLIRKEEGDQGYGFHGDVLRVYEVNVTGNVRSSDIAGKVLTATVECKIQVVPSAPDSGVCHSLPNGGEVCTAPIPSGRFDETQSCLISEVVFN